jgi:hypothetical protein
LLVAAELDVDEVEAGGVFVFKAFVLNCRWNIVLVYLDWTGCFVRRDDARDGDTAKSEDIFIGGQVHLEMRQNGASTQSFELRATVASCVHAIRLRREPNERQEKRKRREVKVE